MRRVIVFVVAMCSLSASAFAQADLYKWKDAKGSWVFGSVPPAPSEAKKLSVKDRYLGNADSSADSNADAAKFNPVVLYVSDDCGDPCLQAKKFLADAGIAHSVKNFMEAAALPELKAKLGTKVPVVTIGEKVLSGFEAGSWSGGLKSSGYTVKAAKASESPSEAASPGPEADGSRSAGK